MTSPLQTLFIGRKLCTLQSVDSTNTYAYRLSERERLPEGTVVVAHHQHSGRGHKGATWISEAGKDLAMSLVLYPNFLPVTRQFQLNKAVSLAIRDALAELLNKTAWIKWPNDIIVSNRKIAGILIQNTLRTGSIRLSIIGIGLNVNRQAFPDGIPNATSMTIETGQNFDLGAVRQWLCFRLEQRYLSLRNGQHPTLDEDYLKHLYHRGITTRFATPDDQRFDGTITGVDAQGRLMVQTKNDLRHFGTKEIIQLYDRG